MIAERIEAPREIADAAALLAESAARKERVLFCGGGTEMGYGYPAGNVGLLLRTTLMDRIVEYSPADLVVEVEAGATLAALASALTPHRQRLAIDPPQSERATVGGVLATNAFGPRRARFGTLRDLIVGISIIRADAERVRGGGRVVKNVAGFDIPKIAVGSLGSLGLIATATFRLHPVPETTRAANARVAGPEGVRALSDALRTDRLEPAALLAFAHADGGYDFGAVFEGFPSGVAEQMERFEKIANAMAFPVDEFEPAHAFAADSTLRSEGTVRVRFAVPPASFEVMHRDAIVPFTRTFERARCVVYPSIGVAFASGDPADESVAASAFLEMRSALESIGGHVVAHALGTGELAERVDPFGTLPPSFPLMRRLKDRFDPEGRMNAGRFIGRL